jgi:hypothetical protein
MFGRADTQSQPFSGFARLFQRFSEPAFFSSSDLPNAHFMRSGCVLVQGALQFRENLPKICIACIWLKTCEIYSMKASQSWLQPSSGFNL